jgi:hypothetical protein
MKTTASNLIRCAGLSAMLAGTLFVFVQMIHPPETLEAVTTSTWVVVHCLSVSMCLLWLFGITGIQARQAAEAGILGLAGYVVTSVFLVLTAAFTFAEAFILPVLATQEPGFVVTWLSMVGGPAGDTSIGVLPTVYSLTGVAYLLGGLLFGIGTLRARILPRWAAGLYAVGTVVPVAFSVLPYDLIRLAAVPVGSALVWLGYAVWSERQTRLEKRTSGSANSCPAPLRSAI